ncbi:MAG: BrnT family toxin [Treponema sp.]|nr:BrnT family toxin [Treponema sp.]
MKLRFEWDEKKNAVNIMKHGVSFEEAAIVFKDPKRIEIYDKKHSFIEDRWITVGITASTVLTVVFTERNGFIRIISACKALKKEIWRYLNGY